MPTNLRPATPADIPVILKLIGELAEYEREPEAAVATPEQIQRALFGDPARDGRGAGVAECLMGEVIAPDGSRSVEGFALFFMNFSTWTGKPGIYLEDLFVRPHARGVGLGKALLRELARIAVSRDCGRVEWNVLDWNQPAIDFYLKLGAQPLSEWTIHRVTGDAMHRLASS
jgi:GNAT superfamily N-acetyltransferase